MHKIIFCDAGDLHRMSARIVLFQEHRLPHLHMQQFGQLLRNDNALLRQGNGRPVRPLPQGDKIPQLLLIRRHDQVS